MSLLDANGISVDLESTRVLQAVSLGLEAGRTVALVGPNASGKSTLLRALAGLVPIASGSVALHGRILASWSRRALARSIALVTAEDSGPDSLRVVDRVGLGRYPHLGPFRPESARDREAVQKALEQTGIAHLSTRLLRTLSEGERQLASLARGLAQEAEILFLDEPASHLDVGHELHLFSVLDEVARAGVAVLAVVHDLQRAAAWASRMLLLDKGRLVRDGAPEDVLASPECASAFQVSIRAHVVGSWDHPLYTFENQA